jgi:hypothetical protein
MTTTEKTNMLRIMEVMMFTNSFESTASLKAQRDRLIGGTAICMYYPPNQKDRELELPTGCGRYDTMDGLFHYSLVALTKAEILLALVEERLHVLLRYGPYSKTDLLRRVMLGERYIGLRHVDRDGNELKGVLATDCTVNEIETSLKLWMLPGDRLVRYEGKEIPTMYSARL